MTRRVRIKDIAEKLGVSSSTVSRALNPETAVKISPEMVLQVKKLAEQMGYCMDMQASSLRTQKSRTIGMLVPDILNPVFPAMIAGAQRYLEEQQYVILTASTNNTIETAIEELQKLTARRVDGLLIASAFQEDASIDYCLQQNLPVVLAGRTLSDGKRMHQVINDELSGVELAIDHLCQLGHSRILHLAGPQNISQGKARLEHFLRYCEEKNIQPEVIQLDAFTLEAGISGAEQWLAMRVKPSAVFAANDMIAIAAMNHLLKQGVNIPQDLSVVGYNNMLLSDMIRPSLTTVSVAFQALGQQAAKLLFSEIQNPSSAKQKILLSPHLIVRESTSNHRTY